MAAQVRDNKPLSGIVIILMISTIALFLSLDSSARKPTETQTYEFDFTYDEYDVVNLEISERWYNWMYPIGFELNFSHDADGVLVSLWNNEYHYHPLQVSDKALWYLAGYQQTSDERYLDFVYLYARKLAEVGIREDNGIYLPYTFDFALHVGREYDVMMAPWYSGLAQGAALSFFSRAFETIADPYLKGIADSLFNTFLLMDTESDAWTACVDSLGYYWIEEYPFSPKTHVLNGFLTAIFGLHDYFLITRDERCRILFQASCTTIAGYLNDYRNPGDMSYYCLQHRKPSLAYHPLAIRQLRYMTDITSDPFFGAFADTLEADHKGKPSVSLRMKVHGILRALICGETSSPPAVR